MNIHPGTVQNIFQAAKNIVFYIYLEQKFSFYEPTPPVGLSKKSKNICRRNL